MTTQNLYINTIDKCVNNIIDSFYLKKIDDAKIKKQIMSPNYVLSNFDSIINMINSIVNDNIKNYNISSIITNNDDFNNVVNLVTNYLYLYFFFYLGTVHKLNDVINILNKINQTHKLQFFTTSNISQYSLYWQHIKDYLIVLANLDKTNLDKTNPDQSKVDQDFMNDYVNVIDSLENLNYEEIVDIVGNKQDLTHNVLKIIIFREIYIKTDKLLIFKILENEEFANAEFKYIDIVDTKFDVVDYAAIEAMFSLDEINKGEAEEVYQMVIDYDTSKHIVDYNINSKINQLFQNKILIPITDDFLRYHKNTEMYESNMSTKINPNEKTNKKNNTKIRYIVTKINNLKNLYAPNKQSNQQSNQQTNLQSNQQTDIDKLFYSPLINRNAVVINDLEEINILRKIELQGQNVVENNEHYEELVNIRSYSIVDYKYSKYNSFRFTPDKTIIAIRYCNFEHPGFEKNMLDYRVINSNSKSNIVGVAIPKYSILDKLQRRTLIPCYKINQSKNMNLIHKNAFSVTIEKLKKLLLSDNKTYSKLLYWIFNKRNDNVKLELFDNVKQLPCDDYFKFLLGKIYDELVEVCYDISYKQISSSKVVTINEAKKILKNLESKLVLIPRQSKQYINLMKLIYCFKTQHKIDLYDHFENKRISIDSDTTIKLPRIEKEKIDIHVIKITKQEFNKLENDDADMYDGFLCQHILTWNEITKYKKNDPNKFNQKLYHFIKKYVCENNDGEYVCKSCYQFVDIHNYVNDISTSNNEIMVSFGLDTELETLAEYANFSKVIKNMDKIIEKITYNTNMLYFVGSSLQTKLRRQEIIKNIIDMIDVQYKTLYSKNTTIRKERLEKSIKKYGPTMTNFFLFKLENEIFTYSSKETDKFKLFKMNNILTYIIIYLVCELNLSQIYYFTFDKLVNYFLFSKFGFNLFDNLYIRISNKNDLAPIKNYKLLCYVIYYISGVYAKLNMFYSDNIVFKPNSINPQIQRTVIHTFVDAINSILEANVTHSTNFIYGQFAATFFTKLNTVYSNNVSADLISRLEDMNKKKVVITSNQKINYNIANIQPILLKPYDSSGEFIIKSDLGTKQKTGSIPHIDIISKKFNEKKLNDLISDTQIEQIKNNLIHDSLLKTASMYTIDGVKRSEILTMSDVEKISIDELKTISDNVYKNRTKHNNKIETKSKHKLEKIDTKYFKNKKYVDTLKEKFEGEIEQIIFEFVKKLESLIGTNVNINNNNYNLIYDVFEIDHDYRGTKKQPIFILNNNNQVKFKKDDPHFKQDVYYYTDESNNVVLYYSSIDKYLIGQKEHSKDILDISNSNCYIKIRYSILNQLKYFGFNYINYKLEPKIKNPNEFINNILKIRLQNLKNSLSEIQQIIYQIKNNFDGPNLNPVSKVYKNKLKTIHTYDENGDRIFNNWNVISSNLYWENIDYVGDVTIKSNIKIGANGIKYIHSEHLLKFLTNDNIVLYYIIQQFSLLLDINNDSYTKVNIAYLIINIIMHLFRNFTQNENAFNDINVKKFYNYIFNKISSSDIISSLDFENEIDFSTMSEEQIDRYNEILQDNKEESEALDVELENEDDFGDEDISFTIRE